MSNFSKFEQSLKRYYVFDIKYKNESFFMKLINIFVGLFNPKFMTSYITTIGNTIYFPNRELIENNEVSAMCILAHEVVHIDQSERLGRLLFSLAYLFPQCLSLLSLGAIFAIFWTPMLWCLLFLLFLAPFPAPWRKKFELEAYTMSLFMYFTSMKFSGNADEDIVRFMSEEIKVINEAFVGSGYFFMWPFSVEDELRNKIEDIRKGVISDTSETYARVFRAYEKAVSAYEL